MKTPFNYIAHLKAKPGSEQALHGNADDPSVFVIYEGWTGQDALDSHFETPHFLTLIAAAEDLVAERGPDGKPFTDGSKP